MTAPPITPASAHERMHLADATGTNPYAYATRMAQDTDQDTAAVWAMAAETYQREGATAMGDIGEPIHHIEIEPIPLSEPVREPVVAPVPDREEVPA